MTNGQVAAREIAVPASGHEAAALQQAGRAALVQRNYKAAIDAFALLEAQAPDHEPTRLALGIALQGAKRHEEALQRFQRVSSGSPERGAAELHAAFSLLALGRAWKAREAAVRALALQPGAASAHCALGQAEAALGRTEAAEKALLAALEVDPSSADVWAMLGAVRSLRGDAAGAEAAVRKAIELDPGHATAKSALARHSGARGRDLELWNPTESRAALGLAVDYLSKKSVFARLPFGEWTQTLAHQVRRGQQVFVVDEQSRVLGYLGWTFTEEALAKQWVSGLAPLSDEQCRSGDCVIINAWAADTKEAERLLVNAARDIIKDKSTLYFKRFYRDGRVRPMRLAVNEFVVRHLARAGAIC